MICFPNAKINFGLNVLAKREDGFHNISSVLFPIPYTDILEYLPAKTYHLNIFGKKLNIPEKDNLVTKAWMIMHEKYQIPPLHVNLLKRIPAGSGLGGGSSNAAFLIKSVNTTFKLYISIKEMEDIALQIGSDCPYFIHNQASIVSGKGELIEPVDRFITDIFLVVVMPQKQVSTKNAYMNINPLKPEMSIIEIIKQPVETWRESLVNDFEKPVFNLFPELKQIKNDLYHKGAIYASLSGSGSALYGVFRASPTISSKDFGCPVYCFNI